MTAYWPTSAVARHLTPAQNAELARAAQFGIPLQTMRAAHRVTTNLVAETALAVICSEGVGVRRVYTQFPSFEHWIALERGGFIEVWDDFGFMIDALH